MKKETYTKYQLECKIREVRDLYKSEIEQLENDNKHLKGAVTSLSERLDAVTKERDAKEESNKKLADQFYAYREKLVSTSHELEGVRGALKREAEMRVEAKKKCDELCEKLVKMGNEFEAYRKSFNDKGIECDKLRDKAWKWDKIHELVNAYGIDTMSKLKDALVELEHKREDVESLKTSLADSCTAKIKEGRDLTAKIESLERELCSAKEAIARDGEEAHKLRRWYNNLKKLYDKARKEGEEGCAMWREDAWKARDDRDFYKKKAENLEHAADDYRKKCVEIEKIQRKHNMLTLESLDNALKQWNYIDGKLSRDLCMPLESLIQLLDEYGVNDFCKLRERLMYGPTTDYINALANVRRLEKENKDLKAVSDDLEKQRKEAVQSFEAASRRNDELQNEVNKLQQRWTDTFNPEDEMLGRKVWEWQDINVILAKHNIENSMVLGAELDTLKEYRKVLDKHSYAADGFIGPGPLDKSLEQLDRFQQMLRDWHFRTIDEFSTYINELHNYKVICGQNLIGSTDELKKSFDELKALRLSRKDKPLGRGMCEWYEIDRAMKKHSVIGSNDLENRLSLLEKYQSAAYDLQKSDGFKWLSETVGGRFS